MSREVQLETQEQKGVPFIIIPMAARRGVEFHNGKAFHIFNDGGQETSGVTELLIHVMSSACRARRA